MEVVTRLWLAFAGAVGSFLDEAAFRLVLAFDVIAGRKPRRVERRWWNRATEAPVLVDVFDWTDDRLLFSVFVWPSLESLPGNGRNVSASGSRPSTPTGAGGAKSVADGLSLR